MSNSIVVTCTKKEEVKVEISINELVSSASRAGLSMDQCREILHVNYLKKRGLPNDATIEGGKWTHYVNRGSHYSGDEVLDVSVTTADETFMEVLAFIRGLDFEV